MQFASSLPFDDESFDLIVSNLIFHEVKDVKNKLDVINEALRVLKKAADLFFRIYSFLKAISVRRMSLQKRLPQWER